MPAPVDDGLLLSFDRSPLATDSFLARSLLPTPELLPSEELRPDVRAVACRAWEERARSEYIGVMVVRRFHGLLVDLNAPLDLQELALAMLLQEQQHTSLCTAAARSFGSTADISFDLAELQQARNGDPIELQLMEMITGTYCIGEVVALALILKSIDILPASPYRDVLRHIARDEILHGRIGARLLRLVRSGEARSWLHYPGDEWVRRQAQAAIAGMRSRDVVESDETELFEDPEARLQLEAAGIPSSAQVKERYHEALSNDVPQVFAGAGVQLQSEER